MVAMDLLLAPLVPRLFEPPANSATRVQLGFVTRHEVTVGVRNDLSADGRNVPTNVPSIGMSALLYQPPHLYQELHGRTPFGVSQVKRCFLMCANAFICANPNRGGVSFWEGPASG